VTPKGQGRDLIIFEEPYLHNGAGWIGCMITMEHLYTVSQKNIPDIFDYNLKTNYQILIIFGTNIPDTTCHRMTV